MIFQIRHKQKLTLLLVLICNSMLSQSNPLWLSEYPRTNGVAHRPVSATLLNYDLYVLSEEIDTVCAIHHYSLSHFQTNGQWIDTVHYGNIVCQQVNPKRVVSYDNKIIVAANDSAQTFGQRGKLHVYDASQNLMQTMVTDTSADGFRADAVSNKYYLFSDNSSTILYQFDSSSVLDWQISEPLLFGNMNSYHEVAVRDDIIYAMCSGKTSASQATYRFVVTVLDTLGNLLDTLEVDPFANSTEVIASSFLHTSGVIYTAYQSFAMGNSRVGKVNFNGNVDWSVTLNDPIRLSCFDSTYDQVFVFTSPSTFSNNWSLIRIQASSGQIIDTTALDSVYGGLTSAAISHVEGVGVYFCYRNSTASTDYTVKRINVYGFNDWNGEYFLTTSVPAYNQEIVADQTGNVYITGTPLNDTFFVCRFAASPLHVNDVSNTSYFNLFPNPASVCVHLRYKQPIVGETNFEIYGIDGSLKKSGILGCNESTINIADLVSGSYILQIKSSDGITYSQKFIKTQ